MGRIFCGVSRIVRAGGVAWTEGPGGMGWTTALPEKAPVFRLIR